MGGTPHANTTHFPNDKSLELVELGTGSNSALRRYETRGGLLSREKGPIPSHPHEGHCRPGYQVETTST